MVSSKIFLFSDLDDTLIQTTRKTDFSRETVVGGYDKEGKISSYMYKNSKYFLDKIMDSGHFEFIPTTARNLESYSRTIFYKNYNFEYAILNFSGVIIQNNRIDIHWQTEVKRNFFKLSINIADLLQLTERYFYENLDSKYMPIIKNIDNQYISIYNKKFREQPEMTKLVSKVVMEFIYKYKLTTDFYVYKNDASFGILPKFLNKKNAVNYIIERYNPPFVIGAGDNVSDLDFMNLADFSLIPRGSTLNKITGEYVRNSFIKSSNGE